MAICNKRPGGKHSLDYSVQLGWVYQRSEGGKKGLPEPADIILKCLAMIPAPKSKIYPAWFVQPCALRSIVDSQFHWQSDIHQQVSTGKARLLGDPEIPNGSSPNPNDADFVRCSERLAGKMAIYERSIT